MTARPARPRVLIVDDQVANIDVLAEALGDAYELFAATTAERALELAASGVDLVLLDVVMPDQDGFELCRTLKAREKTRGIPVIFVTALGEVEDEARGFEAGGVDYIAKPISPATVRARVRTHLELRGAQKRLEKEAEVLAENLRLKEHVERLSRHDLKTPLTSVVSMPQVLIEGGGLSDEQVRMLRAIESAGYRILDMVNRSLDLFRMESGAYEFRPARVDAREVATRVVEDLDTLARESGVTVELEAHGGAAVVVNAEELLTYSMLANLVKNAIEASPRGGVVRVALALEGDRVRIDVANAGAVPAALREGFFRKYASSGKKAGTGLGAYSARLMAETQRGRIAMSTSEGTGTVVSVSLEAAGEAPESPREPRGATAEIRVGVVRASRILLVDDDEPTRFVLSRFLGDAPQVAMAEDGEAALRVAAAFRPDIVFLDAEMPRLDGVATAKRLRALEDASGARRARIIGLSSHDDVAMREAFLRAGCDLVLAKPVTREAVLAAVEAAFEPAPRVDALPDDGEVVRVEPDLLPMLPAFLESRREQVRELLSAIAEHDREKARGLAHKVRGGLEMCGFATAGAMSRRIEEGLAGGEPLPGLAVQAKALGAYLDTVRYASS